MTDQRWPICAPQPVNACSGTQDHNPNCGGTCPAEYPPSDCDSRSTPRLHCVACNAMGFDPINAMPCDCSCHNASADVQYFYILRSTGTPPVSCEHWYLPFIDALNCAMHLNSGWEIEYKGKIVAKKREVF